MTEESPTLLSKIAALAIENWRNLVLIVAAVVAFPLAVWRSWLAHKQTRISEGGQNIDRYQKGAGLLGDKRLSVRQAGILGLRDLALNDPANLRSVVLDLLATFVKDRSSESRAEHDSTQKASEEEPQVGPPAPADSVAAVRAISGILGTPRPKAKQKIAGVDLHGVYLTDANLTDANLTNANLTNANLTNANLTDANLTNANLTDANLTVAVLNFAKLQGANLKGANLKGVQLLYADLTNANLTNANLMDANLTNANLMDAKLHGANLTDAEFDPDVLSEEQRLSMRQ